MLGINYTLIGAACYIAVEGYYNQGIWGFVVAQVIATWSLVNITITTKLKSPLILAYSSLLCGVFAICLSVMLFGNGINSTSTIYLVPLLLANFMILPYKHALTFGMAVFIAEGILIWLTLSGQISTTGLPENFKTNYIGDLLGSQILATSFGLVFNKVLRLYGHQIELNNTALASANLYQLQASKLSALGTVAAGIAHEINNPLAIALGFVELLRLDHSRLDHHLDRIEDSIQRISSVVKSLDSFHHHSEERKPVNIQDMLKKVTQVVGKQAEESGVHVVYHSEIEDLTMTLSPQDLFLALLHLVKNAIEAAEKSVNRTVDIDLSQLKNGASITIKNSGDTIPKEIQTRIFDPFFTTKGSSRHQGVGLAIAQNMVQSMGGQLNYKNVNHEPCFEILLYKESAVSDDGVNESQLSV